MKLSVANIGGKVSMDAIRTTTTPGGDVLPKHKWLCITPDRFAQILAHQFGDRCMDPIHFSLMHYSMPLGKVQSELERQF